MMINDDEIDWENMLNFDDGVENFDISDATSTLFPTTTELSEKDLDLGDLEDFLMNDDDLNISKSSSSDYVKEFELEMCDLLVDSPPSTEREVVNSSEVVVNGNENENNLNFESNCENYKSSDGADDDPLSKKRKRQLRNRDAAMRSRERKKMVVKDLEMKSRYFEEECRRLQSLLHCCYAENHWLRCSLQTYGAPMTKPESAVLLLESLLLGSLVWLMVNICLLPQSKLHLLNQDAAVLVKADRKILETAALRGKGTKISELWTSILFTRSKRCKSSRTKMKSRSTVLCF